MNGRETGRGREWGSDKEGEVERQGGRGGGTRREPEEEGNVTRDKFETSFQLLETFICPNSCNVRLPPASANADILSAQE